MRCSASEHTAPAVIPGLLSAVSVIGATPLPWSLSQIVEASGDAIYSEDLDGVIRSWNAAAERIYGCRAVDVVGRPSSLLVPARTAAALESVRDLALSGQRVDRFDTWHARPDGRHIAVSLTVSPLRDEAGAVAGLASSVQDVTDRLQLAAELEDARRTQDRQNVRLARSNRDLQQFAFVASHDLSEPLRAMTGFVQLLEKRYAPVLDERGQGYVSHVVEGAARMRALIEDLLEYSRYLVEDPPGESVDTVAAVHRVVQSLGAVGVEVGTIPDVWCEVASLEAVLQNLISNALKFHRAGTPPRVRVTGWTEAGRAVICVDDNGIGIEPAYHEKVFGMFARLHVREAYPGTGIGLAIVRQVAERAGGHCWVETSSPLGGARFCLALPAAPERGRS